MGFSSTSWVHLTIFLTVSLLAAAVRFFCRYWCARRQLPGPPVRNIWSGNLQESMADNVHENWRRWHRQYGPIFQTWNGLFSRIIYIGDPKLIAQIANENWPKSPAQYDGFKPLSGDALFAQMDQMRWKHQRKSLAPAFQPQTINSQYDKLEKYLLKFVHILDDAASRNTSVDLSTLHVLLTLDFVGEVAFGSELHALDDGKDCEILHIFNNILPELMKCGLFPLRAKVPLLHSTRRMHTNIKKLRDMGHRAVGQARATVEEKNSLNPKMIFEILAQERDENGQYVFSPEELVDNYVTFLVAGGDPTAHTLTFAVNEILRHPHVLSKLRAELEQGLTNSHGMVPSIHEVSKLKYLHQIIKETLRFNGPGFGTFRYTPVDIQWSGLTIPKNTTLALWNPQVHRDPTIWGPDADSFDPDRWASGAPPPIPGSFFPFAYGTRKCLGQGLAMLEMSLTLATLFQRYNMEFEAGFEMEYLSSFTLCSKNGLPVRVKVRN
ncbi:hypothetical protein EW026_g2692 [Hermanssonia centrifuga]|uniref:Cytochrome P450 n=1 Tax=Hermanssonia centrifuga TaxID=98765 RepID=A0A4S4KMG2_9APHY|nr:hypothetical protein EW026_g2692 [Hermanssonia centrifuga]